MLNSLGSAGSRRVYEYALDQFIAWYCSEPRLAFNRIVVTRYRMYLESRHLAANTINQQLAAVRRLAHEAADAGLLSPELAGGISRVKGVKQLGFRVGNWLSGEECSAVLRRAFGTSLRAKRDYAMLAVLFGCGLRRSELVGLDVKDMQDLRRTCAKLCQTNGGEIEQIQFLLGHASVQTTERYLGCKQDLGHPVNDLFRLVNVAFTLRASFWDEPEILAVRCGQLDKMSAAPLLSCPRTRGHER